MSNPDSHRKRIRRQAANDVTRPLSELLGIKPNFEADELSPPVDLKLLEEYDRHELSPTEHELVDSLIARFRPWNDAWISIVRRKLGEK